MTKLTSGLFATLFLLAAACGGTTSNEPLTKTEARALVESGAADEDVCVANGFLGDGVCDDWCPGGDPRDCDDDDGGDGDICADGDSKQADDGCNTCTCMDGAWACTEMACNNGGDPGTNNNGGDPPTNNGAPDLLGLEIRECDTDTDGFAVDTVKISGDTLLVDVGYSGGCEEHEFTACWKKTFLESHPVQTSLVLEHDANGDMCEAYLHETLRVDLTEMRETYQSWYQTDHGDIILAVEGYSVDYSF